MLSDMQISSIRTETITCPVCRHDGSCLVVDALQDFEYNVPGMYAFRQCDHCDQIFLSPRPIEDDLIHCYPSQYHGYQTRAISRLYDILSHVQMRHRTARYRKLLGERAIILDVGCGDGYIMQALKKRSPHWELHGVEFNREIAEKGIAQGLSIVAGTLETANLPPASFDLLIMNHLIEHLPDPLRTLHCAAALLKPGGYIVGEVPNYDSLDRRVAGRWWGGHHTPRHLLHFTPETLSNLFLRTGLTTVRISPELHTGHWASSVQNRLQDHLFVCSLRNGRALYYPLLLALFIPLNALQAIFLKTGIMSFIAARPRNG